MTVRRSTPLLAAALLLTCTIPTLARQADDPVDAEERAEVIARIGELLEQRYVFEDVAANCRTRLAEQLEAGGFDDATDPEAFAAQLTTALQSVSHDKHMRVRVRPPTRVTAERENPIRARARERDRARRSNYGFQRVELLEGNIGYLDLRYFDGSPDSRPTAVATMNFLGNADALIFDMRKNGGGSPEMIRFLTSYLFDEPTHLNSLYWREGDRTEEFWTLPDVPGPNLADVPAFVLTSSYTFSGAEEFSYNLRTRERATLIGETTGGGANPGGMMPANERFGIFIPTGRAINPVTGTNWEGVGVEPHIATSADDAYDRALELAVAAAEAHRAAADSATDALWASLGERRARAISLDDEGRHADAAEAFTGVLAEAHAADLLGEMDINMLGYELLGEERTDLAIAVLRFNVEAYPKSFNTYDSLGEAYMNAGDHERAIEYYRKSLELEPANDNANVMIDRMKN